MIKKLKSLAMAAVALIAGAFTASAEEAALPAGYTRIEYLQSLGMSTINTGYRANRNTRIEAHFNTLNRTSTSGAFFGVLKNGSSANGIVLRYAGNSNKLECFFCDNNGGVTTGDMNDTDVTLSLEAGSLTINGQNYAIDTVNDPTSDYAMYIFAQDDTGNSASDKLCRQACKLYSFKIFEGNTPKRDFVPCRSPWNVLGLYDRVENKFYGTGTTHNFIGPAADDCLPSGYLPVEYIESAGNAVLDTGVVASSDLSAELDYMPQQQEGNGSFGVCKDDHADWRFAPSSSGCFFDCGDARAGMGAKLQAGTRYTVKVGRNGSMLYSQVFNADGTPFGTEQTASVNGEPDALNVYLFGVNNGRSRNTSKMRLYSFKLSKGGVPVRDFVPCRSMNGEAGLWDKVEGKFYGSFDQGLFTTPAVVPIPREVTLPEGYAKLDWIESSGMQHIDTGYEPKRTTQVTASFRALARTESWASFFGVLNNDSSANALVLRYYENTSNINGLFCNKDYKEAQTSEAHESTEVVAAIRVGAMFINGVGYKISTSSDPYQGSLVLFGERNGSDIRRRQAMRLYGLMIFENKVLVHDYVPCRRESDGEHGLYDLTEQEFLPNGGTGVFIGPDTASYAKLDGDGYAYYTASGEPAVAPVTGITGLPLAFANDGEYRALVAAPERVAPASGVILEKDITLAADTDWTALDFSIGENTINLNGHKLTVGKLQGSGTITDAGQRGELHVNVPSGAVENASVALTGSLKLVKDGNGTFMAHRKGQTYSGGTQVKGGQFAIWNSKADATDWKPSTEGTLGAPGSTIDVDAGMFNIVGNYELSAFNFRLNGGQLASNNRPIQDVSGGSAFIQTHPERDGVGNITLTADSSYFARYNMIQNRGTVDLGGHTLDVLSSNDKYLHWSSSIRNGTMKVHGGDGKPTGASYFVTFAAVDARTVTFDMYEQFQLDNELSVSNYVSRTADNLERGHQGTAALNVYGTFTSVTDFFYGCTMQNGSTLDLSTRTGTWSTTSLSKTGRTEVEFAPGATVYVDLGARRYSGNGGKIVSWTKKPEDVTFMLAESLRHTGVLWAEDDGLYFRRGTVILVH